MATASEIKLQLDALRNELVTGVVSTRKGDRQTTFDMETKRRQEARLVSEYEAALLSEAGVRRIRRVYPVMR